MKKFFLLSMLATGFAITSFAQGHHHDPHHNQRYAQNQGYAQNQYDYYPQANVYYHPSQQTYSYYDRGNWQTNRNLPRNILGNNARSMPVTYRGNAVWNDNHLHRQQYSNSNSSFRRSYDNGYGTVAPDGHAERVKYKKNKTIIRH